MMFETLFIISYTFLYPYIVHAIQTYLNTPPSETFSDCPEFDISDCWDCLTEEEYIEDVLENSCQDTDCPDYKPKPFDIFGNKASDYISHYYQAGGKTTHCTMLEQ